MNIIDAAIAAAILGGAALAIGILWQRFVTERRADLHSVSKVLFQTEAVLRDARARIAQLQAEIDQKNMERSA